MDHFLYRYVVRVENKIQCAISLLLYAWLSGGSVANAQISAASNAAGDKRPVIDNTANGLPLIQIVAPNGAGVSHNQYQQFNVDKTGAILNNAGNNANTQLGGWVGGNPNLPNGGARIILNEITSASPSVLRGYLEVAGQRAEVIVSNPNGIQVDGAGFINASRGVITTGVPVFGGSGSLDAFRVTQGEVRIGAAGFNDRSTNQVEVIARSVKVNGDLYANQLNVTTGANQVNYADAGVQVIQGAGGAPAVAIDVAALNGMYANKIRLVGTESGVGVVSYGKMAATAGDLSINSAGKVTLGAATSATGNIQVVSGNSIVNQSRLSSGGSMELRAANVIDNRGRELFAGGSLALNSTSLDNAGGIIKTNRNAAVALRSNYSHVRGDTIAAMGDLAIDIAGDFVNQNDLTSGGNLSVHAVNIDNRKDGLLNAGQTMLLKADQVLVNTGRVYGLDVALGAQTITNDHEGVYGDDTPAGVIAARNTLNVGAREIVNREHALLKSDGDMAIGGALDSGNKATGAASSIVNSSATIDSGGKLAIAAASLVNANAHFATQVRLDSGKTRNWTEYEIDGSPRVYGSQEVSIRNEDRLNKLVVDASGSRHNDYTTRHIRETTSVTVVTQTDPGRIVSRDDMSLSGGNVLNDKSAIVAGGNLSGQIDGASNGGANPQGEIFVRQDIASIHHTTQRCAGGTRRCNKEDRRQFAVDFPATHFDLGIWKAQSHAQYGNSDNPAGAPHVVKLPDNLLYRPVAVPGLTYMIETDPAFVNLRNFLSSDYLLSRMGMNPQIAQKRLGDGYYEQQMVNDQILQLTGRKTLGSYASNEDQYKALMDAGVVFAQQFQLIPGMSLSASQMAALTTDIVWLVEKSIVMADGTTQNVLTPVVYLNRLHTEDIKPTGALIAAENIDLRLNGTLDNSGTLKANGNLVVNGAQDIDNTLGTIESSSQNGNVALTAGRDINNRSGAINANRVAMLAGRDLNIAALANTRAGAAGTQINLDRAGSITAGTLNAQAQRDINLDAASISATGDATFVAGNNLNLNAVKTQSELNVTYDDKNHLYKRQEQANGTLIETGGNLGLAAGKDINSQAAYLNANQNVNATAAGNINIDAATQASSYDQEVYVSSSGALSSSSTHSKDRQNGTQTIGSTFSGDKVSVQAGKNVNVTGSNVVSTTGTTIAAVENVNIVASQNIANQIYSKVEKQSGVFSGGGIGITIGTRVLENDKVSRQVTNNAGTVGSTAGNVNIIAGKSYTQTGSNVQTPAGDITIAAQQVNINAAHDTNDVTQETRFKQTGLTLQVTNPVLSAIQTVQQMKQAAEKTKDKRMKGLAAGAAALATVSAMNDVSASRAPAEGANAAPAGGIDLAISIGASVSKSRTEQHSSTVVGSTTVAGGNINISATGSGRESNLVVKGSDVKAGNNLTLKADNRIDLLADQSTSEQRSSNSSSSASIGISIGTSGFMVNASASGSRGRGNGSDLTNVNSHAKAGNQLSMTSGGDTNLKGAVASGKQVIANVGVNGQGNFNIESLQDKSYYESQQQSLGGSVSVGAGKMSGSINISKSKAKGEYASVLEQSGIQSGDGGFQINVQGNTDLKGVVIASSDGAIKNGANQLTTQTLTASDIQNKAEASASSSGINLSSDMATQGKYGAAKGVVSNLLNGAKESKSSASTTNSAISQGVISIADNSKQIALTGKDAAMTVASINRDIANAHAAVQKIDAQEMEQSVQARQAIKQAVYQQAVKFTDESYRTMFLSVVKMYEVTRDEKGNMQARELSEDEKNNLKRASDGKVHIANNGIFNEKDAAGRYGLQHKYVDGPQYLLHMPEANNTISELLVAAYQKHLENDLTGLTNATQDTKGFMQKYGKDGLHIDGHSRGAMTTGNALESLKRQENSAGSLSNTTVNFFGPAYNAAKADGILSNLQNRDAISSKDQKNEMVLKLQNHIADPVGRIIGGNPSTGGTVPKESTTIFQMLRAVTGQETTSHNCYGNSSGDACKRFWSSDPESKPSLQPIRKY